MYMYSDKRIYTNSFFRFKPILYVVNLYHLLPSRIVVCVSILLYDFT